MSNASSLHAPSPSTSFYDSSNRIRKKPSSSSDSEEPIIPEEDRDQPIEAEANQNKQTTPTFSRPNTPLQSPTSRNFRSLSPSYQPSSMIHPTNVNIHSIFNKLNTLNEKTKHDDKRSFLHSIKGHMRKNSKEKFHSLFEPSDRSPMSDIWHGSPLQVFSSDEVQPSPTLSPRSPLKSPTVTAYPSFAKSTIHSKKRLVNDNTVEEIAREMEQYYFQNNQKIEHYMDQIATLEKQKRDAVLESKQWKRRSIQAENQLHQREMEFQEETRKLNEKYRRDLEEIKRTHRKKCQQYGEMIHTLAATNEAFRAQLQASGMVPITATPEAGSLVEFTEDHEFIKQKFAAIEKRKSSLKLEEEMAAEIEHITLALGVELRQAKINQTLEIAESPTQLKARRSPRRRLALRTPRSKRTGHSFGLRAGNDKKSSPEDAPSIDHRELKENGQGLKEQPYGASDENNTPLRYITLTRGSSSRHSRHHLDSIPYLSAQSSRTSLSTIESISSTPTKQTNQLPTDTDSQVDVAQYTPSTYEENRIKEPLNLTKSVFSPALASSNTPSRLSVFSKNRNSIHSESPSQRIANKQSAQNPPSTSSSNTNINITPSPSPSSSFTREQPHQLQHTPAIRRKPSPKAPGTPAPIIEQEMKLSRETL